jgi:DNA polymerase I-like protein with 3'-5' exonuclease and polymerase domains
MDFPRWARDGYESWRRTQPSVVAFDTETTGVEFNDQPFCVTAAWRTQAGIESHYFELGDPETDEVVRTILAETPTLVGHNLKFDLQKVILVGLMQREHLWTKDIEDTEAIAHLLDEHQRKGLKPLAKSLLGEETNEDEAVKEAKKVVKKKLGLRYESEIGYHMLPRDVIVPYALKDAEFTLRLYEKLRPKLSKWPDTLLSLYEMEMELTLVLLSMEHAGFAVDLDYAERVTREYGKKIIEAEQTISNIVGLPIGANVKKGEFNPNSPKQVKEWFLDEAAILLPATDKVTLRSVEHPLAKALLDLRHVTKIHGTYLMPLLSETRREGHANIIHPSFRQHGTVTGRMSSGAARA